MPQSIDSIIEIIWLFVWSLWSVWFMRWSIPRMNNNLRPLLGKPPLVVPQTRMGNTSLKPNNTIILNLYKQSPIK